MPGSLAEAYAKRLQLKVKTGDIKPRTRDMKLERLGQCNKVWQNCSPPGGLTLRFTAKEETTRRRRPYEQSF
jgi:hypothetical protein